MTFYIGRESSKLWKRFCAEITTEINLLAENWKYLLVGLFFQYMHGLAARGVHYIHRPGPTLQDVGFLVLPVQELGKDNAYMSETLFTFIFLSFVLWTFHPFFFESKKIYTVLVWCRVLAFLVASQFLRTISFYSTQLPGPNYHCRETCFIKCAVHRVGQSLLIVASRKHYTVGVVIAWYTVNLVVFFIDDKFPELPDRSNGGAAFLLPVSAKEKDGGTKEENLKLLNGNTGDPADWRQRSQVNGKILDDGNEVHVNTTMNSGA